jgi:tripartite-type tricarboxylate transporter receptor subunit TctC
MKIARALFTSLSLAALSYGASGQTYPTKPIRLVVPYPAGGIADTVSRTVAEQLGQRLGQPVIVDNKPGGKQIIGTDTVAKAAPDGYTLLLGSVTSLSLNPAGLSRLPYSVERDLTPVSRLFSAPLLLVTNQPVGSVQELISRIKAAPGKYSYASIGPGTSPHLAAEHFVQLAGLNVVHVPYKGSAPAIADLLGGQVHFMFDGGTSSLPFVQEGRLRLLAVSERKRFPYLPNVSTMEEAGLKGYDVTAWWGLVAPARTPKAIVHRLARELKTITDDPSIQSKLAPSGIALGADGPEQFSEFIQSETKRWRAFLEKSNINMEQ